MTDLAPPNAATPEAAVRDGQFINSETGEVIGPVPLTSDAMTTGNAFATAAMAMEKLGVEQDKEKDQ